MNKHKVRFFFDYGGYCLWGSNGGIKYNSLPISGDLKCELDALNAEFATSISWDDPLAPSLWTKENKANFINRATKVYEILKDELDSDYEIINEIDQSVQSFP